MIARGNNNGKDPYDSNNTSDYGALSDTDVWKVIQTQASKGWFVPSRDEWNAFGAFFKVGGEYSNQRIDGNTDESYKTDHTYSDYKLSAWCWSSSQNGASTSYTALFSNGRSNNYYVNRNGSVRFALTF